MVDWRLDATALAGRHAAYEMELYYDGQSPRWSRVYVRDLETGRLVRSRDAARVGLPIDSTDVRRIVVMRRGSIAWTVRGFDDRGRVRRTQVRALAGRRIDLLDDGPRVAAKSLSLRGDRLTWRSRGRMRRGAAPLSCTQN